MKQLEHLVSVKRLWMPMNLKHLWMIPLYDLEHLIYLKGLMDGVVISTM